MAMPDRTLLKVVVKPDGGGRSSSSATVFRNGQFDYECASLLGTTRASAGGWATVVEIDG